METIVYFNGAPLAINRADHIAKAILKLSLKKGDSFEYFPFNYMGTEKGTSYKEDWQPYHTMLLIDDIKYSFISSWNDSIEAKVEIYLIPKETIETK